MSSTQPAPLDLPTIGQGAGRSTLAGPGKRYDFSRKYWLFAVPAVVTILAVIVFPWLFTLYMSTQDWKIGGGAAFIGLSNYLVLFQDERFLEAVGRTFWFTALAVIIPVILGVAAAVVFHREFPLRGLLRTVFTMPMMATPVAVALVWTMMFHPQLGVLNYLLSLVGMCLVRRIRVRPQAITPVGCHGVPPPRDT